MNNYWLFLFSRALSGCGEASFQIVAPPLIEDYSPPSERAKNMGIFYAAIPVGTAMGFGFGAIMGSSPLGWASCFYIEIILMVPLVFLCINAGWEFRKVGDKSKTTANLTISRGGTNRRREIGPSVRASANGYVRLPDSSVTWADETLEAKALSVDGDEVTENDSFSEFDERVGDASAIMGMSGNRLESDESFCSPSPNATYLTLEPLHADIVGAGTDDIPPPSPSSSTKTSIPALLWLLVSNKIYMSICLAYASYVFTFAGLSTFGPGLMQGLGFAADPTEAALLFGAIIAVGGLIGSYVGGLVIGEMIGNPTEKFIHRKRRRDRRHPPSMRKNLTLASASATATSSMSSNLSPPLTTSSALSPDGLGGIPDSPLDSPVASQLSFCLTTVEHLTRVWSAYQSCKFLFLCAVIALPFLFVASFMNAYLLFFLSFFLGVLVMFATSAGFTIAIMNVVSPELRSFALAFNTFIIHAVGDVPSPILIGMVKDKLAPHCGSIEIDGKSVLDPLCKDDIGGLQWTIALSVLWLVWMVICSGFSYYITWRDVRKLRRNLAVERRKIGY